MADSSSLFSIFGDRVEGVQMEIPSEFRAILQKCATEEWFRIDYGRRSTRPGLRELDPLWQELRGGRPLRATDLDELLDKTHFGEFWKIPSTLDREGLTKKEISLRFECGSKTEDEKRWNTWRRNMVNQLFRELGSLDLTSVLLRCVHPDYFGIYSPPLLCLLQVPIAEPVSHYLAYCDELGVWGRHFLGNTYKSVGDTDQAIWVFYERVYGPRADLPNRDECQRAFRRDAWIRKRHADNLLGPFFRRYPPLKQAEFLIGIDDNLAGKIAGCEFDARVKSLVRNAHDFQKWRANRRNLAGDLEARVEYLIEERGFGPQQRELRKVRKLRNDAIHEEKAMQKNDVEKMIEVTGSLPERGQPKL
jgi:hypothetical protein